MWRFYEIYSTCSVWLSFFVFVVLNLMYSLANIYKFETRSTETDRHRLWHILIANEFIAKLSSNRQIQLKWNWVSFIFDSSPTPHSHCNHHHIAAATNPPGKVVIQQEINKTCFLTLVGIVKANPKQFSKK